MMPFTPEQEQAISVRGNLIVSAAAGAGKTAVLTERVFRLIRDGMPVSRMLILTFTRAAAAEMKGRIQARLLSEADTATEPEKRVYYRRQANEIPSANISTIDAFCSRVVFRHFHTVGLSPSARTMDQTEAEMLTSDTLDRVLTETATDRREDYRLLLTAFECESAVSETLLSLYRFLQAQPDPAAWLDSAVASARDPDAFARLLGHCLSAYQKQLGRCIALYERERDALPPDWSRVIGMADSELMSARGALLQTDVFAYADALCGITFDRMLFPRATPDADKTPLQNARAALKSARARQADALQGGFDQWFALQLQAADVLDALARTEHAFLTAYSQDKRQKNVVDFSDLEHFCDEILKDPQTAAEYRDLFDAVIVDEYQDSNRVQEQILSRIRRKDNLFFVGDVKQSIYGFRSAEPSLFLEKLRTFTGAVGTRVDLSKNFRSSGAVIDAVNRVFSVLMCADTGDLVYDARAQLVQGCPQPEGQVTLDVIDMDSTDIEDGMENAEAEARFCGETIAALMADGQIDDPRSGDRRAYRYDDFAVLLRSTKNARTWAQTLACMGVPCFAQLDGGYFDAIEVMLVLNLLRVIDNRRQDIPLLSVMRSPFGGFSDAELIALRQYARTGSLLDCLLAAEDAPQAAAFLTLIERYRRQSRLLSTEDLIAMLLDESGFYDAVGAITGGAQRQANLDALLQKAHAFDQTGACGVHAFLVFMDKAKKSSDMGAAQVPVKNVVRIMSVHKSKGLEFPVVFLADLGRRFYKGDSKNPLLLHRELGFGLRFTDASRLKHEPFSRRVIASLLSDEQRQEELRVLYVAMTRAKQRLYMLGCRIQAERAVSALPDADPTDALSGSTFLHWLLPVLNGYVPITVHRKSEFLSASATETVPEQETAGTALYDALCAHLMWTYPYRDTQGLPDKTSVTQLAPAETAPVFAEPAFVRSDASASARGVAVHRLLERMPLCAGAWDDISYRNAAPRERGYVDWFRGTDLFCRMCASSRVERELSFAYPADTAWLLGIDSHERVLLQGVIDACFIEDGKWVLLDYKTDNIGSLSPAVHAEKHRRQLEIYREVLQSVTRIPVKETVLVLLRAETAVTL